MTSALPKRREYLKATGMRPIRIWVPDTRQAGFDDECRRQSLLVARSDEADIALNEFMDAALLGIDDEEE